MKLLSTHSIFICLTPSLLFPETTPLYLENAIQIFCIHVLYTHLHFTKQIPLWAGYLGNRASDLYDILLSRLELYGDIMIDEFRIAFCVYRESLPCKLDLVDIS
jgi:hypothetical protein